MVDRWVEVFRAAGVTAQDHVFFAFSFGPFLGFWLAFEAAQRIGCLCIPGGGLGSTARLRVIIDNAATVLCCTPTYAARLAEVAVEERIDLRTSRVKTLMVAGESGGSIPATRAQLAQLWNGARIFDHHGMTEVGPVTFECPAKPGRLHVMESAFYAEVINPASRQPVHAGESGELILTTLHRTGSPVLRYRTGDLVRPGLSTPCACGRHTLALEGGILGRTDDMVIIRGVNVYPAAVEDVIRANGDVTEYQVFTRQTDSLVHLTLKVEPAAGCNDPAALARRLEKALQDAFSLHVPVTTVPVGTLPRSEMKARRWVKG
jgi:phenylacetate-CoA ligase